MSKAHSYGVCPYKIEDYSTKILMVRATGRGDWGFIKGKIDKGESERECARRECKEETNISVSIEHFEDYIYCTNKQKNIGIFLVDDTNININLNEVKLEPKELSSIKWFDINDNIKVQTNQKKILDEIRNKFIKRKYYFKGL